MYKRRTRHLTSQGLLAHWPDFQPLDSFNADAISGLNKAQEMHPDKILGTSTQI
jgi:hypothetical protein